jgi:hypothetical protein
MSDRPEDLTASEINNIGVDWYRTRELTTAFQFFYHSIERFKGGRASAMPPATSTSSFPESPNEDVSVTNIATGERSHENFPESSSTSTPRSRLEGIFANALLFQEQAYRCPFRISHSSDSKHFYFSSEPTQDYILCSCIAVFNMAITVNAMDDVTAAANHIQDRHHKVKGLFAHCLQLLSLVLDPTPLPSQQQVSLAPLTSKSASSPSLRPLRIRQERQENMILAIASHSSRSASQFLSSSCSSSTELQSTLNSVTLATCDLLEMACLNNLIFMTIESDHSTQGSATHMLHLESLLRTVTSIRSERYGNDQEIMAVMSRLADMFLVTVFFLLRFPPGHGAAAA